MAHKKGFVHIAIIGIVVAVMAVGAGSHFYFSNKPIKKGEEKVEEAVIRKSDSRDGAKNIPKIAPPKTGSVPYEKQMISPSKQPIAVVNSDVVQGHPANCYPRLGFDNHRTEQTFVVNPSNNKEMYINVEYKGLYKSVDGGNTWKFSGKGLKGLPRNDDPSKPCHDLRFHLYIDPANSERLLAPGGGSPGRVGEGLGGLSESLDSGATWHQLFRSDMSAYTESAVIDQTNNKIMYVTTAALPQGMDGPDKGKTFVTKGIVYKTMDGGKTWEELPTGLFEDLRVPGIFIDAQNPNRLRLATFGLPSGTNIDKSATNEQWGFLETNDAGQTWTKLSTTLGVGIRHLGVSPTNLNHFYLMASKNNLDKVYYSTDGNLNEPFTMAVNFARYDPHDTTGMRLIGFNLHAQPNDVFESFDGGKTWGTVGKLPSGITNDHRAANIVFDPVDKNVIYINADMARVWKSSDKGSTWVPILDLDKLK